MHEVLLGMLAAAFRRHIDDITLEELQHGLLNSLAGHVASDRRIVALARDLVDLVDEDDTPLSLLDIVVGLLQEPGKYALDILSHIAGLGQDRGVDYGERDVEHLGYRPGHQCLAGTGRSDHEDIGLLELDTVVGFVHEVVVDALVMVVHCYGQELLGPVLADDVLVEELLDGLGLLEFAYLDGRGLLLAGMLKLAEVLPRHPYAVVTDVPVHAAEKEVHLALTTAAETAMTLRLVVLGGCHAYFFFFVRISSTMPYSLAS